LSPERYLLGPDDSVELCDGVVFIGQGLIPVGGGGPGGDDFVVRRGEIPPVRLAELIKRTAGSGFHAPAGSPEPSDPEREGTPTDPPQSPETASRHGEQMKELRTVFGEESVFGDVRADDARVALGLATLAAIGATNSDMEGPELLGVECGPQPEGHLAAVVCYQAPAVNTFSDKNPGLYCIGTVWGCLTVIWVRLQGPVPRNLLTGSLAWVSQGIVPVSLQGDTAVRFQRSGARIPLTRFDEIQWDPAVSRAFAADEIQQSHGAPFLRVRPRAFALNPLFLSKILLSEFDLGYDGIEKTFRRFDAGTLTWGTVSRGDIFGLVTNRLIRLAHDFPKWLSPSEVTKSTVSQMVWFMEIQGAVEIPTDQQAVELFFNEGVESCVGAELTQAELFKGLVAFCQVRKLPLCSKAKFDRAATRRFGETSHCFGEKGTSRGRAGWRLRRSIISNPTSSRQNPTPGPDGQAPPTHA